MLFSSLLPAVFHRRVVASAQVWDLYSREDEFNSVLKEQLCECMNRDPTLPDPPKEKLCRRGRLQVRLTATFNGVSATD